MPQQITVGRIVRYCLSEEDAKAINRRRVANVLGKDWPAGAQAHIGNEAIIGQHFPMLVVRCWDQGNPEGTVNGRVFLDGTDDLWVTSIHQGGEPGTWRWPPRV